MAETIIPFPRREEWLASFDLVRCPERGLALRLIDARQSLIDAEPRDSAEKLDLIATMVECGLEAMRADAIALKTEPDSHDR